MIGDQLGPAGVPRGASVIRKVDAATCDDRPTDDEAVLDTQGFQKPVGAAQSSERVRTSLHAGRIVALRHARKASFELRPRAAMPAKKSEHHWVKAYGMKRIRWQLSQQTSDFILVASTITCGTRRIRQAPQIAPSIGATGSGLPRERTWS